MTYDQEDEPLLSSEISWSFTNVHTQLLDLYPSGKALTDILTTVDGLYEWQIDFYPNGQDLNDTKISVVLTLRNVKTGADEDVDAECNYYLIDKSANKNYVGKIARRCFRAHNCEQDTDFDNSILRECDSDCLITFNITQYTQQQLEEQEIIEEKEEEKEEKEEEKEQQQQNQELEEEQVELDTSLDTANLVTNANDSTSDDKTLVDDDFKIESVKQLY